MQWIIFNLKKENSAIRDNMDNSEDIILTQGSKNINTIWSYLLEDSKNSQTHSNRE